MATNQSYTMQSNRYRQKCPAPLTEPSSSRYQPYQRPLTSQQGTPINYVPTPPCPAPGTWANTFSYDDYSTRVWANDVSNHQQHLFLQYHSAMLQADILKQQYLDSVFTPKIPSNNHNHNIAVSMMMEESVRGHLSSSAISRVSPDGDICDDVLDANTCLPDTSTDVPEEASPSVDTSAVVFNFPPVHFPALTSFPVSQPLPRIAPDTPMIIKPEAPSTSALHPVPSAETAPSTKTTKKVPGNHVCKICGKMFGWRTGLLTHLRLHTGERPFSCPVCPKSFADHSTYTKHCRIHSGDKPYSCGICGKAFSQSGNRLRHMRTVHKNKTQ